MKNKDFILLLLLFCLFMVANSCSYFYPDPTTGMQALTQEGMAALE